MARTTGALLRDHAFNEAAYAEATAARAVYEAGQPTTASLDNSHPLLAIVGDMVSAPDAAHRDQEEGSPIASRFQDVSDVVVGSNCTYFVCLGDNVYERGQLADYQWAYHNTFGRVNAKCLPMPGNHEYLTLNAADYYTYFGLLAGVPGRGYYAVNIANWRFYALNSNGAAWVAPGSPQALWFATDMAAHHDRPKIVTFHHPRWTDGGASVTDDNNYDHLWQLMHADGKVQLVVNGHDHNYQRWDRITSNGPGANPTPAQPDGITQFVVGCGGNNFFTLVPPRNAGGPGNAGRSTYGHDRVFGALFVRLGPASWDWVLRTVDGVDVDPGTLPIH